MCSSNDPKLTNSKSDLVANRDVIKLLKSTQSEVTRFKTEVRIFKKVKEWGRRFI